MKLPRDLLSGNYVKPRLFLCDTDKEKICQLHTTNTNGTFKLNSYSELSFDVSRTYNDTITGEIKTNPFYNKIESPRLIYLENLGYFELQGPEIAGDGIQESKSCSAYSLEYTLSQKYLENFYVNTGEIGSIEVTYAEAHNQNIIPITLYNPTNPDLSLLHLILEKAYGWSIGHIDASLQTLSRQFEIDRESIYDFLINEVCEKFNCYIVFDTIDNKINIYAESLTSKFIADGKTNTFMISPPFAEVGTVSVDGYKTTRWEYNSSTGALVLEDVPSSGSHIEIVDGALTQWETDVFVSFNNLAQEININYDADSIKTVLTVTYGDDNDIREANLGLPYLTDLSYYYTVDWMGKDLYDAYTQYLQHCNEHQSTYTEHSHKMQEIAGQIDFEENRLSLKYSIVQSVSVSTVGKYYVRGGTAPNYYYTEVSLPSDYDANETYYSMDTANLNESKVANLLKVLKQYYNQEDTWETELEKLSNDFQFMEIYTLDYLSDRLKNASVNIDADAAVSNFLGEMWQQIGRTPLKMLYYEPYKKVQVTNIEAGWSQVSNDNYWYYYPVVLLLNSIDAAVSQRDAVIQTYEIQYNNIQQENVEIANELTMDKNFTEQQLIRLNAFLREDELHLDDIVDTSQDSLADSFKVKQDAMESGRIELQKLCQPQLQFSMTMANIYALPEFEPIIDQFQLGNVIKVGLRSDYIKQSRLLQVDINFDDFSDFSCEFGDLTNLRTQSDIHADLLSQAITAGKSVATNASYWTKGSDQANSIDLRLQEGLLNSIEAIKSIDGTQNSYLDKWGFHLEAVNPDTGEIDDKRVWMVNNQIVFTDDGFKTSKSVLGEFTVDGETYYGLLAQAVIAGLVEGSTIRGGTIHIGEYYDDDGQKQYRFSVDELGNVTMNAASIVGYVTSDDMNSKFEQESDRVLIEVEQTLQGYSTTTDMNAAIEQTANSITSEVSKTYATLGQVSHYGTCSTASNVAEKTVVCENFKLYKGASISVKFTYANSAQTPQLNVNGTGNKNIAADNYASLSANSNYTWDANSTVNFVYDGIYWRIADSGSLKRTATLSTKIIQTEESITSIAEATSELSTKVSEIEQTADGITSTVSTLEGKTNHYGTCTTAATTAEKVVSCSGFVLYTGATISVKFSYTNSVATPKLNVNKTGAKNIAAYNYASLSANSNYIWDANSTVNFVYDGIYWRIADSGALSKIKQTADSISLKVDKGDLGTLIEQNYDHVKIAWNKNSNYVQFENGAMCIYTSSAHSANNLLMKHTSTGAWYYNSGTTIGRIGTNNWSGDSSYRGLVFDLESSASYMCWAAQDSASDTWYTTKLIYHHKNSKAAKGLHFACNTYADNYFYLNDTVQLYSFSNGSAGLYATSTSNASGVGKGAYIQAARTDEYVTRFSCYSDMFEFSQSKNSTIKCYNNIDMCGYSVLNQSDARLKTNIENADIDAIGLLNQIEMKQFDWIENGEHEDVGIIAQQLQALAPALVWEDPSSGKLSIKTDKLVPYLVKAIQELTEYITGGMSTFSLRNQWSDPYTDEEKDAFVAKTVPSLPVQETIKHEPILIPINGTVSDNEQKENLNE